MLIRKTDKKEAYNREHTESYIQIVRYLKGHKDVRGILSMQTTLQHTGVFFSSPEGLSVAMRIGQPTFEEERQDAMDSDELSEKFIRKSIKESLKVGESEGIDGLIELTGLRYHPLSEINKDLGRIVIYGSQGYAYLNGDGSRSYAIRSPMIAMVVDVNKSKGRPNEFASLRHHLGEIVSPYNEYHCNSPPGIVPIRLMVATCENREIFYINHHPMYWQTLNSMDLDNLMRKAREVSEFLKQK